MRLNDEMKTCCRKICQMETTYYGRLMKFFELEDESLELADRSDLPRNGCCER
jgi:hypothetical protein